MEIIKEGLYDLTDKLSKKQQGCWSFFEQAHAMEDNPDLLIDKDEFIYTWNNLTLIYTRDPDISQPVEFLENDTLYYSTPIFSYEESIKSTNIVTKDDIVSAFFYQTSKIPEALAYMENHVEEDSISFYYSKILSNILHGPYTAIVNVLKEYTDKEVTNHKHIVYIDNKTICIGNIFYNHSGTFQQMYIAFNHDSITEDSVTGIQNEIPSLSDRDKFMKEVGDELYRLTEEVESLTSDLEKGKDIYTDEKVNAADKASKEKKL